MSSSEPVGASLVADGADWVLIVERTLAHPSAPVWAALTEVDQLASWGPFRPTGTSLRPGRCSSQCWASTLRSSSRAGLSK
jgi:uncharacterized protein YndB with AHSA1/START domain